MRNPKLNYFKNSNNKPELTLNSPKNSLSNTKLITNNNLNTNSSKCNNIWNFKIKKASPVNFYKLPQNLSLIHI